jgi:Rrf2 family protein
MQLSALEEYGLRCALQLAKIPPGSVLAASQIAEREGISVQYASKIMHLFRKSDLVRASRGIQGGFFLSAPAHEVSLRQVFSALRDEKADFCQQYKGKEEHCVHIEECQVRPVWKALNQFFEGVLGQLTLSDLSATEAQSRQRAEWVARQQAEITRRDLAPLESQSVHQKEEDKTHEAITRD